MLTLNVALDLTSASRNSPSNRRKFILIGFIDRNGRMVIEPTFVDAYSFSEGLAAVAVPDARDPNQLVLWLHQ
jgi:hypothetical protein